MKQIYGIEGLEGDDDEAGCDAPGIARETQGAEAPLNRERNHEREETESLLAISSRRKIVLYSKSHAYLISQNYGSSCSSFNGSSVATRSLASRFFRCAIRTFRVRCVCSSACVARNPLFALRESARKIYKSSGENVFRENEERKKNAARISGALKNGTSPSDSNPSDPRNTGYIREVPSFKGYLSVFLKTMYYHGFLRKP